MPPISRLAVVAVALVLCGPPPAFAQSAPSFGSASSFAVLGGSAVRNSGTTRIAGNVGVSPGSTVTGLTPDMFVVGAIFRNDAIAQQAKKDSNLAVPDCTSESDGRLDGKALAPGVHCLSSPASLTGTLTLDACGDRNAVWIFRIAGTLTTAADSAVFVINGGYDGNIVWHVGGSATLGADSTFVGNILAATDITLNRGARLSGRAFARTGTVSMNNNQVSICCNPIALSHLVVSSSRVGSSYSQTISASGGLTPYVFRITSGSLPPGLTLTGGVLSGTPTTCGRYPFTVTATDALGCAGTASYSIDVEPALRIEPPDPPDGTTCSEYRHTLKPAGGTEPYTFAPSGALPPGISLSEEGVLFEDGFPKAAGTFTFSVMLSDARSCSISRTYTVTIAECPIKIVPESLPPGIECTPYSVTLSATGGTPPYTFKVEGDLPPGLDEPPLISGTPSKAGTYTFVVTVIDAGFLTASRRYTMEVICPPITIAPATLTPGTVASLYSVTFSASSACPGPYTLSVDPELPPDLTPDLTFPASGLLSGIPKKQGPFEITVKATTASGCFGTRTYTLSFLCPPIVLSDLPTAIAGVRYEQTITASGAIGPYEFTAPEGTLPADLTLLSGGELFGTPLDAGPVTFTVTARDTISGCDDSRTYSWEPCPVIAISTTSFANGTVGVAYSETIAPSGGIAPYSFTVVSGSLPPGLTFCPGDMLCGTPTTAGSFGFTIRVTDAADCSNDFPVCTIEINPVTCPSGTVITLSPATLPPGAMGTPYAQAITPSGGTVPYAFSVTSGSLPPGLMLDPLTGIIFGTPTANGAFDFTITATDVNACRGSRCYSIDLGVGIPTLSAWALAVLSFVIAAAALAAIRRAG